MAREVTASQIVGDLTHGTSLKAWMDFLTTENRYMPFPERLRDLSRRAANYLACKDPRSSECEAAMKRAAEERDLLLSKIGLRVPPQYDSTAALLNAYTRSKRKGFSNTMGRLQRKQILPPDAPAEIFAQALVLHAITAAQTGSMLDSLSRSRPSVRPN